MKFIRQWSYTPTLIVLIFLQCSNASAQNINLPVKPSTSKYIFEELKFPNGNAVAYVVDLVEDVNGFIWLASKNGLIRYDGHSFKVFRHKINDNKSIVDSDIRCLTMINDTTLAIGCDFGLSILNLKTQKFTNYPTDKGICPTNDINYICLTKDNTIWIAGESGLYSLPPDRKKIINHNLSVPKTNYNNTPTANRVYSISEHPLNTNLLFLGTECGLLSFDIKRNKIQTIYFNHEISKRPYSYPSVSLIKYDGKYVWTRSWESGLNRLDLSTTNWKNYGFPSFYNGNPLSIGSFILKNDKEIWLIDNNKNNGLGIFQKETGKINFVKDMNGMERSASLPTPLYLYMQQDSTLWLSSVDGLGLIRQNKNKYKFLELDIPFSRQYICDYLFEKESGCYYFGMLIKSKGIAKWNSITKKWTLIKPINNPDKSDFPAYLLYKDHSGTIWVGTGKRSLWVIDKKQNIVKPFRFANGKPLENEGYSIVGLFEDSKHRLWIGTSNNGVICLNESRTKATYFKHDSKNTSTSLIKGTHFRAFEEDNQGNIWMGNGNGFCVFDSKTDKFSKKISDMLYSTGIHYGPVYSISKDTLNRMWMILDGQGLVCVSNLSDAKPKFKIFQIEQGLKSLNLIFMTKDRNGCFWISNNGLLYFNPYNESYMMTDLSNGLIDNATSEDRIYVDDNGNVFYGNQVGINWVNEVRQRSKSKVKNLFIEQLTANGKEIDRDISTQQMLILQHSQNNLSFNYTAICFDEIDQIRYRYKLTGLDTNWSQPTNLMEARYNQLKPGKYRFIVDVAYKGNWLNKNVFVDFKIKQVFWKTWWFLSICLILIGAIIYSILNYRINQYLKMYKMRLKIASDLHDNIGSTLSSISIMSDLLQYKLDNSQNTDEIIKKIGSNAHEMLESMDDIIWSVNPSNDEFKNLALRIREYAIPLLESKGIVFDIIIPDEELSKLPLSMEKRRNIFLIAKEAINNLVKYSACTKAKVHFRLNHPLLTMIIEDNGEGFDPNKETKRNGLKNIKKRAEQINGNLIIESKQKEGTKIVLTIKLN